MPPTYNLNDIFDPNSPFFNGAISFSTPPSAQHAFLAATSPSTISDGEITKQVIVQDGHIESGNFVTGEDGWQINANGDAEFNGSLVAPNATFGGVAAIRALKLPNYTVADLPDISADVGASDNSIGTIAWNNPGFARAGGGFQATYEDVSGASKTSEYLKITDFDYAVPTTATILGIEVQINRIPGIHGQTVADNVVKLVKADGTLGSENKAAVGNWATGNQTITYGSSTDLWGEVWTPADINDVDFGAVLSVTATSSGPSFPSVDMIRVIVYYTGGGTPIGSGSLAFAINGRKAGETAGNGTGVMVFHDGRLWKACDTGATVAA